MEGRTVYVCPTTPCPSCYGDVLGGTVWDFDPRTMLLAGRTSICPHCAALIVVVVTSDAIVRFRLPTDAERVQLNLGRYAEEIETVRRLILRRNRDDARRAGRDL